MNLTARVPLPGGGTRDVAVGAPAARLGRDPACEIALDAAAFPVVSATHAKVEWTPSGAVLTPLSRSNKTLLNGRAVDAAVGISAGDRVRLGATGPTVEIVAVSGPPKATPADFGATLAADAAQLDELRRTVRRVTFPLTQSGDLGRDPGCEFPLPHPLVSRRHAHLTVGAGAVVLTDLGSANGTFVNGKRVRRPRPLRFGDRIDVGPFALTFDGATLATESRSDNVELVARGVGRVVADRATGEPLHLLRGVDLVVKPGEFVCLLGPSGSGKSTLLRVLSGRVRPDAGAVAVNGADLHAHFAALKHDIAVVPQKDALLEQLTAGAALRYTAELRLPPDTPAADLAAGVSDILATVGLSARAGTPIRDLSGGQVKRASLANELLCRPSLLFLDEVTSGLDEQADREMMELFRRVADGGKTVVCVTHNLAGVEAFAHLLVVLTEGGRPAFVGPPAEAKAYFGVGRLGDVYRVLAGRKPEEWEAAFRASPAWKQYVGGRLAEAAPAAPPAEGERSGGARPGFARQATTLLRRSWAVWRADAAALAAVLGQSLLVALLLALVFGDVGAVENPAERVGRSVNLLFLMNVACFWFGCNNAAKELVRERVVYGRERDFNLRADSYLAAKLAGLLGLAAAQVLILYGVAGGWCRPPGPAAGHVGVLLLLAAAGTSLGLLISAASPTPDAAAALVPAAVIPQIILGGVIAPLSGVAKGVADALVTCRWGEQALERLLPAADAALAGASGGAGAAAAVVALHAAALAGATLAALARRR